MSLFGGSKEAADGKIGVVGQIRAKAGSEDKVRAAFQSLVEPSRQEPGCLKYELYEDKYYTGVFFTDEVWESEEQLMVHLAKHKGAFDEAKAMLAEDMRTNVLKLVE